MGELLGTADFLVESDLVVVTSALPDLFGKAAASAQQPVGAAHTSAAGSVRVPCKLIRRARSRPRRPAERRLQLRRPVIEERIDMRHQQVARPHRVRQRRQRLLRGSVMWVVGGGPEEEALRLRRGCEAALRRGAPRTPGPAVAVGSTAEGTLRPF